MKTYNYGSDWQWDADKKTYVSVKSLCHTGNTLVLKRNEKEGGLYIGGWTRDAVVTQNTHVIDLTGTEHKWYSVPVPMDKNSIDFVQFVNPCKGWLSLPFEDFKTPKAISTPEQWQGIASVIDKILKQGTDVLVACQGGHGRSGLFVAIVGYILGVKHNRAWASPVEHVRTIHCDEAIETYSQEQFVYDMLKLDIKVTRQYFTKTYTTKGKDENPFDPYLCELCGEKEANELYGVCGDCSVKYAEQLEEKDNLTEEDMTDVFSHDCDNKENCIGLYKAKLCGHVVHDRLVLDGLCEACYNQEYEEEHKQNKTNEKLGYGECAICRKKSIFGGMFGVCYDCQQELKQMNRVDTVHDTNTDGWKAMPHHCDKEHCDGVYMADMCGHVVHDMEVVDGYCEDCFKEMEERKNAV